MKVEMSFHNRYYPWTEINANDVTCWLKGTVFYKNKLLQSDDAVRILSSDLEESQSDHEALKADLLALNGNFAFAMETSRYVFCTVDRVRSIPLFYAVSDEEVIFSDDANYLRDRLNPQFNEENGAEFLVSGYVTGSDTLFDGISQLQAGEYLVYDKKVGSLTTDFYYRFWHGNFFSASEEELLDQLDETFVRVFQRLIASTKGLQIVVPLSGGLDSRITIAMLKQLCVEDVICFSYGKKGNREAEISRQVAKALGYKWYFVEYTREKLYDCYHSDEMQSYMKYSGNLVSLPIIQDFLAVRELKEKGKIPENAVLVPGHTGDMISGGQIPHDYTRSQIYTLEKFFEDSLKMHYSLWRWSEAEFGSLFKGKIQKSVGKLSVFDNESCANAIELFDFDERHGKYIINSVRVYEFFGYQWRMPLWDTELIDFFLQVPISYRINQLLYKYYAKKRLFTQQLQLLSAIDCTTDFLSIDPVKTRQFMVHLVQGFSNRWKHFFDFRWYRYFKYAVLFRVCSLSGYRGSNPFWEGGPLHNIVKYNEKIAGMPTLGGFQTQTYLKEIITASEPLSQLGATEKRHDIPL